MKRGIFKEKSGGSKNVKSPTHKEQKNITCQVAKLSNTVHAISPLEHGIVKTKTTIYENGKSKQFKSMFYGKILRSEIQLKGGNGNILRTMHMNIVITNLSTDK